MRYFGFLLFLVLAFLLWLSVPVAAEPACPNGVCESPILGGNENSCTCPQDCGSCAPGPFEVCKQYFCDSNNDCRQEAVLDCCGNSQCEPSEYFGSCQLDCGSAELNLEVDYSSDKTVAPKGETIVFIATITDFGAPVDNAMVVLEDPRRNRFPFSFLSDGKYLVSYRVPFEMPIGRQAFRILAVRSTGIMVEGFKEFFLSVEAKPFALELLLPIEKKFGLGDAVWFRVHAQYAANQPVLGANSFVIINGQRVPLAAEGGGFYAGEYALRESDTGSVSFEAVVADRFENKSSVSGTVEVVGVGLMHYVQRFGALFFLLAIVFSFVLFVAYRFAAKAMRIQGLEKRKAELVELEKSIQTKYFEQVAIEKTEFDQFMGLYESEIKELDKKLFRLKKQSQPQKPNAVPQKPRGGLA